MKTANHLFDSVVPIITVASGLSSVEKMQVREGEEWP